MERSRVQSSLAAPSLPFETVETLTRRGSRPYRRCSTVTKRAFLIAGEVAGSRVGRRFARWVVPEDLRPCLGEAEQTRPMPVQPSASAVRASPRNSDMTGPYTRAFAAGVRPRPQLDIRKMSFPTPKGSWMTPRTCPSQPEVPQVVVARFQPDGLDETQRIEADCDPRAGRSCRCRAASGIPTPSNHEVRLGRPGSRRRAVPRRPIHRTPGNAARDPRCRPRSRPYPPLRSRYVKI